MGKKNVYTIISLIIAIGFTVYIALDTFVISRTYGSSASANTSTTSDIDSGDVSSDEDTYSDDNMTITVKTYRENDTDIYVADVVINNAGFLKTALADGTYGKNITETTSEIAESVDAILAINGDYYGVQESGYVIRNGTLYRSTAKSDQEDLVIYQDGSMKIINEDDVTAQELIDDGAVNVLSFGPGLIEDGQVSVTSSDEVDKAMTSNPRTAIGIIDDLHYVFVVADGRTSESTGLSLYQLANFMDDLGCLQAYNLDGGGSSTMVFQGNVVNNPTTTGSSGGHGHGHSSSSSSSSSSERSVSDIVYIGY